jgi:hypothetical protein
MVSCATGATNTRSVAAFPFPTKPFSEADETGLKPSSAPIVGDQTMESINVRHHPQRNLSRIHANLPFRRKDRRGLI